MLVCGQGDLKEAKELYDFFASDLSDLPDHDPVQPNWMDNTKNAVNGLMEWFRENQDTLVQGYDFVRGIISRGQPVESEPVASLPPINDE